jgi:hypothetical protein
MVLVIGIPLTLYENGAGGRVLGMGASAPVLPNNSKLCGLFAFISQV